MSKYSSSQELLALPDRYVDARIDDRTDPGIKSIAKLYIGEYDKFERNGLAPAFFGSAGSGKTHAAAAIARLLVNRDVPTYWAGTVRELNLLMDHKDYKSPQYFSRKNRLLNTKVVVFDDFGQLRDFPRIRELFFEIVDYRYAWQYPTIYTANFEGTVEDVQSSITQCFNSSLARRIIETSKGLLYIGA